MANWYSPEGPSEGDGEFAQFRKQLLSEKMKRIPLAFYSKICIKLDIQRPLEDDYRLLGEKVIGLDKDCKDIVTWFCQKGNPTKEILGIFDTKKGNSIGKFQEIVNEMGRNDVSVIIEEWISDEWKKRNTTVRS